MNILKRGIKITVIAILVLVIIYMIMAGCSKVSDAFIGEYTVTEDGKEMTVRIGVAGSFGGVSSMKAKKEADGIMYLDCYSAYNGFNGKLGEEGCYTFPLDEDITTIVLYRSGNKYEIILEKNSDGTWERIPLGSYIEK